MGEATGVCSGKYDILQRMISILIVRIFRGRKAVSSEKTARQRAKNLLLENKTHTAPSHYHAIIMRDGWQRRDSPREQRVCVFMLLVQRNAGL